MNFYQITLSGYMKLYGEILIGGMVTIIVAGVLIAFGWYVYQWTIAVIKLTTWHFARKMQPHLLKAKIKKVVDKATRIFSFEVHRGTKGVQDGKSKTSKGQKPERVKKEAVAAQG